MPKIAYVAKTMRGESLRVVEQANAIIAEYQAQGFDLTLRQLYYQFVARGFIANRDTEYKRLGGIVNDARLAGLIDWDAITDRTRNMRELTHWDSPEQIIRAAMRSYFRSRWEDQPYYVEVWVEKEALAGVVGQVAEELDVPYFSCRGYVSQSEMWAAAQRLLQKLDAGKRVQIIHLGDHDPSGIDMSRDIEDRLNLFTWGGGLGGDGIEVNRIALNLDQVRAFNPPPNPAKITDSRASDYIRRFGGESWELDALDPTTLANLIREAVLEVRDEELFKAAEAREAEEKVVLTACYERWAEVSAFLGHEPSPEPISGPMAAHRLYHRGKEHSCEWRCETCGDWCRNHEAAEGSVRICVLPECPCEEFIPDTERPE